MAKSAKYPSKVDLQIWQFCLRERLPQWAKLLYFEWTPPWHLYVLLLTNLLSHRYQPLPLQASHCVFFFWSVTLPAGLPLHSRMSPGVTACSSGCKTNMPRHVGVHLHHSCHVACSAAWKTNMPRHVGDHLNHSCHVGCGTAWKTNMPGHCGKPSESVMECHLQMRLDNKHAKTYQATTWFKTELLIQQKRNKQCIWHNQCKKISQGSAVMQPLSYQCCHVQAKQAVTNPYRLLNINLMHAC